MLLDLCLVIALAISLSGASDVESTQPPLMEANIITDAPAPANTTANTTGGGFLGEITSLERKNDTYWVPLDAWFDNSGEYLYVLDDNDEPRLWGYEFSKWSSLENKEDTVSKVEDFDPASKFIRSAAENSLVVVGNELAFVDISDPFDVKITQRISTNKDSPCSLINTQDLTVVGDLLFSANKKSPLICSYKLNSGGDWEVNAAVDGKIKTCGGEVNVAKRMAVDTEMNRLVVGCAHTGFEVFDINLENGTISSLGLSEFDNLGDFNVFYVLGIDLYASVGGGFKRFHVERESGSVVQGEGAVIADGENQPVFIKDMVTSTDGANIYVLTSDAAPKVLTYFRDQASGGLRHRDTSAVIDRARRLAYNRADDDSLVVLSDKLVQITRAQPTSAPTSAPSPAPTASPTVAPTRSPTAKVETVEPTVSPTETVGEPKKDKSDSDDTAMVIGIVLAVASVCIALCITMICISKCRKNREEALLGDGQVQEEQFTQEPEQQV